MVDIFGGKTEIRAKTLCFKRPQHCGTLGGSMRQLFLASSFADVSEIFFKSVKGPLKGKTVTFIPTASLHEEVTFYVDAAKEELEKQGLLVDILEISTATTEEILSKLKDNDYIYVTGGNTFFLLSELRRTGADEVIIEQIKLGKVIHWRVGGFNHPISQY